ncbi:unnamed protein product [Lasius platythorax]|uniref:Crustin 4 n=2 Tax=Lasius TaxID=488720 RepID=A0A0J7L9H5_LASNI|nr:crustin 4 [Lasius niger]
MRGNSLYLLLLFVILTKAYVKSCKYWCKMGHHRYYCCPNGKNDSSSEHSWHSFLFPWFWFGIVGSHAEHPWHEVEKMKWKPKKQCPPLRPQCPRMYEWYKPPKYCDSDHECEEGEKCCYDVCLEHKTCKTAE